MWCLGWHRHPRACGSQLHTSRMSGRWRFNVWQGMRPSNRVMPNRIQVSCCALELLTLHSSTIHFPVSGCAQLCRLARSIYLSLLVPPLASCVRGVFIACRQDAIATDLGKFTDALRTYSAAGSAPSSKHFKVKDLGT